MLMDAVELIRWQASTLDYSDLKLLQISGQVCVEEHTISTCHQTSLFLGHFQLHPNGSRKLMVST